MTGQMQTTDRLLTDTSINRPSKEEGKALGALVRQKKTSRLIGNAVHFVLSDICRNKGKDNLNQT